jgi:hypothetical protein
MAIAPRTQLCTCMRTCMCACECASQKCDALFAPTTCSWDYFWLLLPSRVEMRHWMALVAPCLPIVGVTSQFAAVKHIDQRTRPIERNGARPEHRRILLRRQCVTDLSVPKQTRNPISPRSLGQHLVWIKIQREAPEPHFTEFVEVYKNRNYKILLLVPGGVNTSQNFTK